MTHCSGDPALADVLRSVFAGARRLGLIGGGSSDAHIEHAEGYVAVLRAEFPAYRDESGPVALRVLDLGSGAGIPGLVVALALPSARVTLLDASAKRAAFLRDAVDRLGVGGRCAVLHGRAEELGRHTSLREAFTAVTARSFGGPAVTVECAAPFLRLGGVLVTSEPPDRPDRWPSVPLATVGMGTVTMVRGRYGYAVLHKGDATPERFPRRVGVPAKRPLF